MAGRSLLVGLMGFGRTGRQFFDAASRSDDMEVVAVADIGDKDVLHALLCAEVDDPSRHRLEGNFLVSDGGRARLMCIDRPAEMPWDVFEVDMVVDATGVYRSAGQLQAHLDNGAPRVLMRTLPVDDIDRIVVPGINDYTAEAGDRLISAGSATFTALALLLDVVSQKFDIECGSMTTVHANSSREVIERLEVLMLMGAELPVTSIHRQIGSASDLVVHIDRLPEGKRVVSQVSEVVGLHPQTGNVMITDIFNRRDGRRLRPTGYLPTFIDELVEKNLLDLGILYGQAAGAADGFDGAG